MRLPKTFFSIWKKNKVPGFSWGKLSMMDLMLDKFNFLH
jgi:hypothetical protein